MRMATLLHHFTFLRFSGDRGDRIRLIYVLQIAFLEISENLYLF